LPRSGGDNLEFGRPGELRALGQARVIAGGGRAPRNGLALVRAFPESTSARGGGPRRRRCGEGRR